MTKYKMIDLFLSNVSTQPLWWVECITRWIFKWSEMSLSSEFSFYKGGHIKVKKISLAYYLPITREGIVGSIPFQRVLMLYETETALSRIWTWVVMPFFNDNNPYTKSTLILKVCQPMWGYYMPRD